MFCNLLMHHSLKYRSPHISVAAQRARDPQIYVGMNISNGPVRLGDWQPEGDDNFFIQILETCTCVIHQ
jgi:hypothetical protein